MYTIIRKHSLKNAYVHGKAVLKAVMPKVIGELPEAKKDINGLVKKINNVINEVNKLSNQEVIKELKASETLRVDTGCITAFTPDITFDIKLSGGLKSMIFGGEGIFLTTLTGPGMVILQSLPFSRFADRI